MSPNTYEIILRHLENSLMNPDIIDDYKRHYRKYLQMKGELVAFHSIGANITINLNKENNNES